jgi:hypothetical protein
MPCLDGWLDVHSDFRAATALALLRQPDADPTDLADCILGQASGCTASDAWGSTIYIANGNDNNSEPLGANYATVPYRMAFKSTTPWGQDIIIYAVQIL